MKCALCILAVLCMSACTVILKGGRAGDYDTKRAAAKYQNGQRQAQRDLKAGIYAVPHFFCEEQQDLIDLEILFFEKLRRTYGVDYCSLGTGPMLRGPFVEGYNSVAIPAMKARLGGRSLGEIYKETEREYRRHPQKCHARALELGRKAGDTELLGENAERLWKAAD